MLATWRTLATCSPAAFAPRWRSLMSSATPTRLVVGGHRALLHGPLDGSVARPPLVMVGGTAQWLDSWAPHLSGLARQRQILVYETRGQAAALREREGLPPHDLTDCTLRAHAADFWTVVRAATEGGELRPRDGDGAIDVLGFSFGARVAMAAAADAADADADGSWRRPPIRRLCVTGVAADRGASGRLALESWRASLGAADLPGFVWRLVLDTHSAPFVARHESRVSGWVDAVVRANTADGVRAIVEQSHLDASDENDAYHPLAMAARATSRDALLIAGELDALAPLDESRRLADRAGWAWRAIEAAGHAVPIEQPTAWRRAVLDFLDARD